jgi:hypothetical protein
LRYYDGRNPVTQLKQLRVDEENELSVIIYLAAITSPAFVMESRCVITANAADFYGLVLDGSCMVFSWFFHSFLTN